MELSSKAMEILKAGSAKIRVRRSGMYQQITFTVKKARLGSIEYSELFTERLIEMPDMMRIAEEIGLPVECPSGRAFPKGKGAADFAEG
jgi:hypothetical protein